MPFKKGQSGNPKGRPRGTVTKPWTDALRLAVNRTVRDEKGRQRKRLNIIAEATAKAAEQGDMLAIREIADRLEGKVSQTQVIEGGESPVRIVVETGVERAAG